MTDPLPLGFSSTQERIAELAANAERFIGVEVGGWVLQEWRLIV